MNKLQSILPIKNKAKSLLQMAFIAVFSAGVFGFNPAAYADNLSNAIQQVTASQQGNNVIVKVTMKNSLDKVPLGFSTQAPPRIALDFQSTSNDSGKNLVDINLGSVRNLNIVQAGERSRLVFNLNKPLNFASVIENNLLIITIDNSGEVPKALNSKGIEVVAEQAAQTNTIQSVVPTNPTQVAPKTSNNSMLRDIDFRKGQNGEGRIIIDLPNKQVGVDVHQQGNTIVADFAKTKLPDVLRRRLDVTDFGTPVQSIMTTAQGDNVHMVIEPKGTWEHSVYQSDSQLVIEVKPIKIDPNKLTQGTQGYRGEKLSLNFQDVEVRALLQVIAEVSGFSVIASDTVTGRTTLRLKDIPWDQALEIIMQSKNLDMRKNGSVIWVAPKDELLTKERLELEQKAQIGDLETLKTETFQLNYQKVASFKGALGLDGGNQQIRILSKRGSAVIDTRSNQMFVTDVPSRLDAIRQLVLKTDIPSRQVLIEARLVVATDDFSRNLGSTLGFTDARSRQGGASGFPINGGSTSVGIGGTYQGVSDQTLQTTVNTNTSTAFTTANQFFSLPASAINGVNPASLAVSLFSSAANRFLNMEISALEADGNGKVISSPRVVTADQVPAIVEQGTELPYQQATSSGATSVTFKKANLKLEVTPQITPDGNIILDVDVNNDTPGVLTTSGYAINTQHLKTIVMVENGGTVLLGGIFQETEQDSVTKVPLLGDIPFLGYLFKSTGKTRNKTELLIFITPKIISEHMTKEK